MLQKYLRSAITIALLSMPMIPLLASTAHAGKSNFWIYNDSSYTIKDLYLSSSSLDDWNNDLLSKDLLYSGDGFQVDFADRSGNICFYDIKAIFTDGQVLEDYRVNVCTSDYYRFFDQ